ncbi:hypothetical protein SAICODRAFT_94852 [Saitoella complicata NRRL Y-17804]|uniref:uncharacterized protein n=1 Tax=Saitoella complicata (strain BCRC 22490 / CBS 7301 / JCM 7358 / NBRC 10748 / NRRL Y-17804) TaxID=698492 RepID=UPI000866C1B7|nr:uncharacterized protein SAICODRAFT_94852 [Saitoella complicata NRRL Y-17804]ODQ51750.1 hypothetical protein SAICODRAFT_94852 [Saitoella complicata NRRL Y-17804]
MKLNAHTVVYNGKVTLVPYEAIHVPKYHEWMKDPAILEATASEPLSLEEEYEMQRKWREDGDKLTFIVLDQAKLRDGTIGSHEEEVSAMIGDVNLFLSESYDDGDDDEDDDLAPKPPKEGPIPYVGEVELMIAEPSYRGRGFGRSSLLLFLLYVLNRASDIVCACSDCNCRLEKLMVKIGEDNQTSLKLFESIGFVKAKEEPSVFREWELHFPLVEGTWDRLVGLMKENEWGTEAYPVTEN